MLIFLSVPAYHIDGHDFGPTEVEVEVPVLPPEGTRIGVPTGGKNGVPYSVHRVALGAPEFEVGWKFPSMTQDVDMGTVIVYPTSWVNRPGVRTRGSF